MDSFLLPHSTSLMRALVPLYIVQKLERVLGLSWVIQKMYLLLPFRARLQSAGYSRHLPLGHHSPVGWLSGACVPGGTRAWEGCPSWNSTLRIFHRWYFTPSFLCRRVGLISVGLCNAVCQGGGDGALSRAGPSWAQLFSWSDTTSESEGKKDSAALLNCHEGRKAPFILCFVI